MSDNNMISATKAARVLGINRNTIYKWIRTGRIPEDLVGDLGPAGRRTLRLDCAGLCAWAGIRNPLEVGVRQPVRQPDMGSRP